MYCANCGIRSIDGASYCHSCGHRLDLSGPLPATGGQVHGAGPRSVPWRGGQVGLGILLVVIFLIPVTAVAVGIDHWMERYDEATIAWVGVHLMGLAIIAVVWRLGIRRYRAPLSVLGLVPAGFPSAQTVLMTFGILGASLAFTVVYAALMELIDLEIFSPPDIPSDIAFPGVAAVFTFQALALVTPLTEELFFRGFIFAGLIPRMGVGWAIVASAAVFSLFHLAVGVLIPIFVTGLLLGWLYYRTGSLWPCVLAHAGQNALAVAVEVYVV